MKQLISLMFIFSLFNPATVQAMYREHNPVADAVSAFFLNGGLGLGIDLYEDNPLKKIENLFFKIEYNLEPIPDLQSDLGRTLFSFAVMRGKKKLINDCLEKSGYPLYTFAIQDSITREALEALICKGRPINVRNEKGATVLMFACLTGYKEMVEVLLDMGADINLQTIAGYTPLMLAASKGCPTMIQEISADSDHMCKTLITHELNRHRTTHYNAIVKMLIKKGAKLGTYNSNGKRALTIAKDLGHVDIIKTIKKNAIAIHSSCMIC